MSERIGFIGVGRMGSAMAKNMLEGGESVVAFDVDADRVEEMAAAGAETADSVSDLVAGVDVVFSSLPDGEAVESVYLDEGGVVDSLTDGMAVVETSTVKPETVERVESAVDDRGLDVDVVDCPVIGIPETAERGDLTTLIGASDEAFERVAPLLELTSETVQHVGPVGRAKAIKLVNNVVTYGNYAVAAEAFALAQRLDIGREEFFEIIDDGAAQSSILASKFPNVQTGEFEPGFTVDGTMKDLRYALELGYESEYPMSVAEAVRARYAYAGGRGHETSDYSVLMQVLSDE